MEFDTSDWGDPLLQVLAASGNTVIGMMAANGEITFANPALLSIVGEERSMVTYCAAPSWESLTVQRTQETPYPQPLYDGLLTLSDGFQLNITLHARLFQNSPDRFLLLGEYNISELTHLNDTVLDQNHEINTLQREVMKKNIALENTLKELRQIQDMLIQSEKMNALGQMVAGIAHEINNPISFVLSNLHSLKEEFPDIIEGYEELEKSALSEGLKAETCAELREEFDIDFLFEDTDDLLKGSIDGLVRVSQIVRDLRQLSHLDEAQYQEIDLSVNLRSTLALATPQLNKMKKRFTVVKLCIQRP